MRLFYCLFISLFSLAFVANGQVRDDRELSHSKADHKSIHLFPNPAVDFVHVRFEKIFAKEVKLTVHNIIGNEVRVETEVIDEHEIRVRVKDLETGYYLLAVKDENEHFGGTYKFLKR